MRKILGTQKCTLRGSACVRGSAQHACMIMIMIMIKSARTTYTGTYIYRSNDGCAQSLHRLAFYNKVLQALCWCFQKRDQLRKIDATTAVLIQKLKDLS